MRLERLLPEEASWPTRDDLFAPKFKMAQSTESKEDALFPFIRQCSNDVSLINFALTHRRASVAKLGRKTVMPPSLGIRREKSTRVARGFRGGILLPLRVLRTRTSLHALAQEQNALFSTL